MKKITFSFSKLNFSLLEKKISKKVDMFLLSFTERSELPAHPKNNLFQKKKKCLGRFMNISWHIRQTGNCVSLARSYSIVLQLFRTAAPRPRHLQAKTLVVHDYDRSTGTILKAICAAFSQSFLWPFWTYLIVLKRFS